MSVKIIIGADLAPTEKNFQYFKNADVEMLIGKKLQKKLECTDFAIFNLEVPLTDRRKPIDKCGPNLIAPTYVSAGLKAINPYFFTLANNHILDQGMQGLMSTVRVLEQAGIKYAGAGINLKAASAKYVENIKGIRVGIYCCAEHEFTVATENSAGANAFDPLESFEHISRLKRECDYVIVLYHGGKEHYRYPTPGLQKVCRRLVDKGANLVVCQHSHCIGCEEVWNDGNIVYGQGNFLFDGSENEFWQTGLLIELEIQKKLESSINVRLNYIPLRKQRDKVRLAEGVDAKNILHQFYARNKEIKIPGYIEQKYKEFADNLIDVYLNSIKGKESTVYRIFNKLSGNRLRHISIRHKYDRSHLLALRNWIECESHRELLLMGIHRKFEHCISSNLVSEDIDVKKEKITS